MIRLHPFLKRTLALRLCLLSLALAADAGTPSPLADAAQRADWPAVASLLKDRAQTNAAQPDGMTALHWAAQNDSPAAVAALLKAGADARAANAFGVTPLSLACVNGNEAIVSALLEAGADADTSLRGGETALMTAARTGRTGPVKALLARGAKIDATDRKAQSALMWAAAEGHSAVVELLVQWGADFRRRLPSGFTPLLFAAREGRINVVHVLLAAGADANDAIETDRKAGKAASALILAVENAHFELAMILVRAGADPNDARSGFTPLHTLSWVRKPDRGDDESGQPPPEGSGNLPSLDFVRQLVAAGADVNLRLEKPVGGHGHLSLAGAAPFLMASRTADVALMKLLVELGADPLLANKDGTTPLMAAAGLGCYAPTEEAGTEPECLAAVDYLLSLGADINTVDSRGETAMHGAAYKSLPGMVRFLAAKGARIDLWNRKNKSGWTPLLIAEGYRPGNFKPSLETIAALHSVMMAAGVTPPPPAERPAPKAGDYPADKTK